MSSPEPASPSFQCAAHPTPRPPRAPRPRRRREEAPQRAAEWGCAVLMVQAGAAFCGGALRLAAPGDARPGAAGGARPIRAGGGDARASAASPGLYARVPQPPAARTEHEGDRAHPGRPVRQPDRGQGEEARRRTPAPLRALRPPAPPAPPPRAGPRREGSREAPGPREPHPASHSPLRSRERTKGRAGPRGGRATGASGSPPCHLHAVCPLSLPGHLWPAGARLESAAAAAGTVWAWPSSPGSLRSLEPDGWVGRFGWGVTLQSRNDSVGRAPTPPAPTPTQPPSNRMSSQRPGHPPCP